VELVSERAWLSAGGAAIAHRGPDDLGEWWSEDGRVGLHHRRLAVVDLSPLGHQPMRDEARGITLIYNGEIYNYQELRSELSTLGYVFRTQTDTEVLLAAYAIWGDECLSRLNGMFAFALHDAAREHLLLGRDRAGEKPLFFRVSGKSIQFGSELKALLADPTAPRRIDLEALDCYLSIGYVPGDRCILQGFRKLPPAHVLKFDLRNGATTVRRYWALPQVEGGHLAAMPESQLLADLENLLEDAVGRQMTADVPVGILLSGGVDSSLITAMAVRHCAQVRTFSIVFPGYGEFDESLHARMIANHFGTKHTELIAEPASADLLPHLAAQFDEPIVDSSMVPTYLVSKLVREHCTVALGGDGGDELFGGYSEYSRLLSLARWGTRLTAFPRKLIASVAEALLPMGFARSNVRAWLIAAGADLQIDSPLLSNYFDRATRCHLMSATAGYQLLAEGIRSKNIPQGLDLIQRATRLDFANYLAEDILVKVDRASMACSLEVRAPLLDYRVIEFAFGRIPSRLKATANAKKIMLKRLAATVLPPAFDMQRKQGFSIPLAKWLQKGPFRDLFWEVLSSRNCLFDRRALNRLLHGQDRNQSNEERLFALVQFELWRRHYGVGL
jgi:asparagine synthase (glutamine-hydrolysing)